MYLIQNSVKQYLLNQIYHHLKLPQKKEFNQRKNVTKKLYYQLATKRKQPDKNYNSFKSYNEFPHNVNKTPPTTPTQLAKRTALIARDSIFFAIEKNRLSLTKANSFKVTIFRGATKNYMKDFLRCKLAINLIKKRKVKNYVETIQIEIDNKMNTF